MSPIKKDLMNLMEQKDTMSQKECLSRLLELCGCYGTEAIWNASIELFGSPYKPF